jgi:hypothetical protein
MEKRWVLAVLLLCSVGAVGQAVPDPAGGKAQVEGPAPAVSGGEATASDEQRGWLRPGEDPENRLVSPFFKHLAADQKEFWTAPTRLQVKDLKWILPSMSLVSAFIASDSWWSKQVPASHVATSKTISDYGAYSLIGLGGASFALGYMTGNDHLQETGLLGGEATINSTAVAYLFKGITQRQRPMEGNGHGDFFKGGASFPSEHSAIAWSMASVWAHEYPGWFSQMAAYGLASTITVTRVTAKQHFPSDAIVGSALGWYFGRQVYRAHHDPEVGGAGWGSVLEEKAVEQGRNPNNMASPYVPLDSWIYPAVERLAALGYLDMAYMGIRPWTRMECARMLEDAGDRIADADSSAAPAKIYRELSQEFSEENARLGGARNLGTEIESVYTRVTKISGRSLRDSYHFGETIVNDFGRPFSEGWNNVTGASARAVAGPFAFYLRGEYQYAPAAASDSPAALQAIGSADFTHAVSNAVPEVNRLDILEGSISFNFHNTQVSFGKQSLWLGPSQTGSWLMSNNAEPMLMLKVDSVAPFSIPLLSRLLGGARSEYFIGQLAGHQFEFNRPVLLGPGGIRPQPYLDGAKISFKPTSNFEFGMGFTAQFVGPGLPFTWGNFLRTFYSHTVSGLNPGKRISSADFSYRVPHLRDWLTVYGDSLVVDEYSPLGSTRASVNPGIYMPQLPKVRQMDLRAEWIHETTTKEFPPGFVYFNVDRFRSGYTNDGQLLANWIGRAGRGGQGWLSYHFTPRSSLQFGYRLQEVSPKFIKGGRLVDYSVSGNWMLSTMLAFSGSVQREQWRFPILSASRQSDVAASFQFTFLPHWRTGK